MTALPAFWVIPVVANTAMDVEETARLIAALARDKEKKGS